TQHQRFDLTCPEWSGSMSAVLDSRALDSYPLHVFNFVVKFLVDDTIGPPGDERILCSGAFSECTGLEATMEPKVIKEGGRNYGVNQRSGPVTFATVVLKRGMTKTRDLYKWFEMVGNGSYAYRLVATITMFDTTGKGILS